MMRMARSMLFLATYVETILRSNVTNTGFIGFRRLQAAHRSLDERMWGLKHAGHRNVQLLRVSVSLRFVSASRAVIGRKWFKRNVGETGITNLRKGSSIHLLPMLEHSPVAKRRLGNLMTLTRLGDGDVRHPDLFGDQHGGLLPDEVVELLAGEGSHGASLPQVFCGSKPAVG